MKRLSCIIGCIVLVSLLSSCRVTSHNKNEENDRSIINAITDSLQGTWILVGSDLFELLVIYEKRAYSIYRNEINHYQIDYDDFMLYVDNNDQFVIKFISDKGFENIYYLLGISYLEFSLMSSANGQVVAYHRIGRM